MTTFAALLASATALAGDLPPPADIRAARDRVFERPEFQYGHAKTDGESFLEMLFGKFRDFLEMFHEQFPALFAALMIGATLALVLLVAHLVWTWRVARRSDFRTEDPSDLEAALRRLDPAPFRAQALAHAAAGRYDEAVRDLYTALLLTLDRRGALRYARHKSLLDYRYETASDAVARAALAEFEDAYPPGSFGRHPPDPERFSRLVRTLDRADGAVGAAGGAR